MGPALSARCVGRLCVLGPPSSLITELYLTGPTHPTRYPPTYSTRTHPPCVVSQANSPALGVHHRDERQRTVPVLATNVCTSDAGAHHDRVRRKSQRHT